MIQPQVPIKGYVMDSAPAPAEEEVYKGPSIAAIRELAEKLGAQVEYEPKTARVTVNGKEVPYTSLQQGKSYGSVHDIVAAAGGKVEQLPDGSYRVTRKTADASPSGTSTPVTGNTTGMYTGDPTVMANGQQPPASQPVQGQAAPLSVFMGATGLNRNTATNEQFGQALVNAGVPVQDAVTIAQNRNGGLGASSSVPGDQSGTDTLGAGEMPIDYNELARLAGMEANLAFAPQIQRLRDIASRYQQQYGFDAAAVQDALARDIANLRAGEVAREGRINEDMNRRGSAIYNSGIRFAALRDQQVNAYNKELGLTQKATEKLSRLANSLNLRLQDLASQEKLLTARQGDKAVLSLRRFIDSTESKTFKMREMAWRMYVDQANLSLDEQKQANTLWLGIQRIKSQDERAAAELQLRRDIANGNLQLAYTRAYGVGPDGQQTVEAKKLALDEAKAKAQATGYVYGPDGNPLVDSEGNPIRTLQGAKFDFEQEKFFLSQGWKEFYQGKLLQLREQDQISDQEYRKAQLEISQGRLELDTARLLETIRHNKATEANSAAATTATQMNRLSAMRQAYTTKFGPEVADLLVAAEEQRINGDYESANMLAQQAAELAAPLIQQQNQKEEGKLAPMVKAEIDSIRGKDALGRPMHTFTGGITVYDMARATSAEELEAIYYDGASHPEVVGNPKESDWLYSQYQTILSQKFSGK